MNIGEPQRIIEVVPLSEPQEEPLTFEPEPAEPEPLEVPEEEPERVDK